MNESRKYIIAAIVMMVFGQEVLLSLPIMLASIANALVLNEEQLGILASTELFTSAIAAFVISLVITFINLRLFAFLGTIALIVGNFMSITIVTYSELLNMRILTGAAAGVLVTIGITHLGKTENPDRNLGFFVAGSMTFQIASLFGLPFIDAAWGMSGIFICLTLIPICILFTLFALPQKLRTKMETAEANSSETSSGNTHTKWALIGLFATFLFFLTLGAFWGYVERFGNNIGLELERVGLILGVTLIFGLAGSLIAAALTDRLGRIGPITFGVIVMTSGLVMLLQAQDELSYGLAVGLITFVWAFNMTFLMGLIASLDTIGRWVAMIVPVQAAGIGLGPLIGAGAFSLMGYPGIIYIAIALLFASYAVTLPVTRYISCFETFTLNGRR